MSDWLWCNLFYCSLCAICMIWIIGVWVHGCDSCRPMASASHPHDDEGISHSHIWKKKKLNEMSMIFISYFGPVCYGGWYSRAHHTKKLPQRNTAKYFCFSIEFYGAKLVQNNEKVNLLAFFWGHHIFESENSQFQWVRHISLSKKHFLG